MKDAPFHPKVLTTLVILGTVSFLSALVWAAVGTEPVAGETPTGKGNDTFSQGALGHSAVAELLRELEYRVVIGRFASGGRAGSEGLLVLAESQTESWTQWEDPPVFEGAERILIVLPKWRAQFVDGPEGPVASVSLIPIDTVRNVLWHLGVEYTIMRPRRVGWGESPAPALARPQLIKSTDVDPIIEAPGGGILFGKLQGMYPRDVYVLSDPDLIANHGLDNGSNARIAIDRVIDVAAQGRRTIVFDETLHGFAREPSFWASLFRFPLVLVTMQVALAAVVLLWAAVERFGAPVPVRRGLDAGKGFLIENIASLLRFGGHRTSMLRRYLITAVREVHKTLHAPGRPGSEEARVWLDRYGEARGVEDGLTDLEWETEEAVAARRLPVGVTLDIAGRIHRWREEMIHGPGRHS